MATPGEDDSATWLGGLTATPRSEETVGALHALLLRAAFAETARRCGTHGVSGAELEDLAHQAADDATLSVLRSLDRFRGESRFTTWAYAFVAHEVASKVGRHAWRRDAVAWSPETWARLPERLGSGPEDLAVSRDLLDAFERAVAEDLTARQRTVLLGVLDGTSLTRLTVELGASPGALHKVLHDARRKIRRRLVAAGHLGR